MMKVQFRNSNIKLNVNALFICIIYQTSQPDRYFPYIKTLASIQQHRKKKSYKKNKNRNKSIFNPIA